MLGPISPGLLRIAERAKQEPEGRFHSVAHLIDVPALERAYRRARGTAAVGVDGITKEEYGRELESNLEDLHLRMKEKRYRHQPIRRVQIPKGPGKTRPLGISSFEDKLVQDAIREVLQAIYEQDFLECSYGFRPGRSAHDAVRTLNRIVHKEGVRWILEADVVSFFDSIDRTMLREMLGLRIIDGSMMRLIGKCLRVGVLDGEELSTPEAGTAQGSVLSPLLGNIYLHYVLDLWFERDVKPRLRGRATLIRYCDDFIIGFEREDDAKRVFEVLGKRFEPYGLKLHPEKTRLVPFRPPPRGQSGSKGTGTFDFLGFMFHWGLTRKGRWMMKCKTRRASLRRAIVSVYDWCRRYRHLPVRDQHAALCRRLQGHFNYFGVNGNSRSLQLVAYKAKRSWFKWLCRRSHRKRLNWERFTDLLDQFPLPWPRITVQIWE